LLDALAVQLAVKVVAAAVDVAVMLA